MHKVLGILRQFQQHTDAGSTNRDWNLTTNLVITGKALMQIHGDWMKGEFRTPARSPARTSAASTSPAARRQRHRRRLGLLQDGQPGDHRAQNKFASILVDPEISAEFAAKKGSTPVVLDAPTDKLDECNKIVLDTLKDPAKQHQNPHNTADADWFNATWDVVDHFWADPR